MMDSHPVYYKFWSEKCYAITNILNLRVIYLREVNS